MKAEARIANERAKRNNKRKKQKREERSREAFNMKLSKDIRQIFLGEDCEPITEELISELSSQGYNGEELKFFKANGFQYCRPRDSFIQPMEEEIELKDQAAEEKRIWSLLSELPGWICQIIVSLGKDDEVLISAMIGTRVFNRYVEALIEKFQNPGQIVYEADFIEKEFSLGRYKEWMN